MRKTKLLFALSIVLTTQTFGQSGTLSLTKGQKFSIENKITAVNNQEVMGQSMESKADVNTLSTIEVQNVKDNNFDLTNNIAHLKAVMSVMGQEMGFDSDKKEDLESDKGTELKNVINHPKNLTITNSGKIISGSKEESKKVGDEMAQMMVRLLGDNPTTDGYGISLVFIPLPKNVAPGYSWMDSSSNEETKKKTTYTVKEINGSDALITFTGTTATESQTEMQGVQVSTKISGTLKGQETIDTHTGVLKIKNSTVESTGTLSAQGMDIPMTTKITSVLSVKGS